MDHLAFPLPEQLRGWGQGQPTMPSLLIGSGLLLLLAPSRLKQTIMDVTETVIASFLLLVIIVAVLGLPCAAVYIAFKGVVFTLSSITGMTYLHDLLSLSTQAATHHT